MMSRTRIFVFYSTTSSPFANKDKLFTTQKQRDQKILTTVEGRFLTAETAYCLFKQAQSAISPLPRMIDCHKIF
ncbi:unknown protein [Desulfotalea psychrophila LSv54]|uniref:Uncharacterized protein n=1 Tax=Desulfotalea psychrophila (strain LSv54 / DSM 12343) TaxID=177439 RepID=Q6AQM6_DESPS|nr:unknown protein [Desulfotalea psychrophila LSv54]